MRLVSVPTCARTRGRALHSTHTPHSTPHSTPHRVYTGRRHSGVRGARITVTRYAGGSRRLSETCTCCDRCNLSTLRTRTSKTFHKQKRTTGRVNYYMRVSRCLRNNSRELVSSGSTSPLFLERKQRDRGLPSRGMRAAPATAMCTSSPRLVCSTS